MTFIRRLPKRGFNNTAFKKDIRIVNVMTLNDLDDKEVTPATLVSLGIIKKQGDGIKILGKGKLHRAVDVHAHAFSAQAKAKIEQAGGQAIVIRHSCESRNLRNVDPASSAG